MHLLALCLGVNEFDPTFGNSTYTTSMAESAAVDTQVVLMVVTDGDHGPDGKPCGSDSFINRHKLYRLN